MTDSGRSDFDLEDELRRRLVDLGAALEEISSTSGYRAIIQVVRGLEDTAKDMALESPPEELTTWRGQVRALRSIRVALEGVRQGAVELAVEEQDEATAERLGIDLGRGDFAV